MSVKIGFKKNQPICIIENELPIIDSDSCFVFIWWICRDKPGVTLLSGWNSGRGKGNHSRGLPRAHPRNGYGHSAGLQCDASQPTDPAYSNLDFQSQSGIFIPNFSCICGNIPALKGSGAAIGRGCCCSLCLLLAPSSLTCHVRRLAEGSGNCEAFMFPRL